MDQNAFRQTYQEINPCRCLYEKSLLSNRAGCAKAQRFCIAEREGVECLSTTAQTQCDEFLTQLQHQARFALKVGGTAQLPHPKALRLQLGGLEGLDAVINPDAAEPRVIDNIFGLISAARSLFGELNAIPFQQIIPYLAAHQEPERRTRHKKRDEDEEDL